MIDNSHVGKIKKLFLDVFPDQLKNIIESVYLYGSYAAGDFQENSSDIDLFIVIKDSLSERFILEEKILESFWKLISIFFNGNESLISKNHNATILSVYEFKAHCRQYPARVLYPLKKSIWKLIYGENIHEDIQFPNEKTFNIVKAHDFDSFAVLWHENIMNGETEKAIKYFLRSLRKYLWIVHSIYVESKNKIICKLIELEPNKADYKKISACIKKIKKTKNIFLIWNNVSLLNDILCSMGKKILVSLDLVNKYSFDDFFNISAWRDYSWEFRQFLNQYHNIKKTKDRAEFVNFLIKEHHKTIQYFCWAFSIPKAKIRFGRSDLHLVKRSYIFNYNIINFKKISFLLKNKSFYYIAIHHKQLIESGLFFKLSVKQLESYIEKNYLKKVEEIFLKLIDHDEDFASYLKEKYRKKKIAKP